MFKAISIGYSTEDGVLFLDEISSILDAGVFQYYNEFVAQHDGPQMDIQAELDRMKKDMTDRFVEDADVAGWDENVVKFLAAIKDKVGVAYGWSVEYDDNLMFLFDTTAEQVEALEDLSEE